MIVMTMARLCSWVSILSLSVLCGVGSCDAATAQTNEYDGQIGAVTTHVSSYSQGMSPRFDRLRLGSDERFEVGFDLLGSEEPVLVYRLVHCNADWLPSGLQPIEYVSGFASYELEAPEPSRNTLVPYVHYQLSLPNEMTQFRVSGNYLLEISRMGEEGSPLLTIPLGVSEECVGVQAEVITDTPIEVRGRLQQVNVSLSGVGQVARPEQELSIVVLQNGRWDNAVRLSRPSMRSLGTLTYDEGGGAVFQAGNEYHKFEHLMERGGGMGVNHASVSNGLYAIELFPVDNRAMDAYRYESDHNGRQVIRSLHTDLPETEADYHLVDFICRSERLLGGSVVLEGEAFEYIPIAQRTLTYDESSKCYRTRLLLKMGYREYLLLFRPDGASRMSTTEMEGDHYQTTNSYTVLVYQRSPGDRSDRLVASWELNEAR